MAWQAVILHQFGCNCNMSILTTISNCTAKLFSNHRNFTICSLVNFFTKVIPTYCGTLMSKEKDWYQWGGKSCIIGDIPTSTQTGPKLPLSKLGFAHWLPGKNNMLLCWWFLCGKHLEKDKEWWYCIDKKTHFCCTDNPYLSLKFTSSIRPS